MKNISQDKSYFILCGFSDLQSYLLLLLRKIFKLLTSYLLLYSQCFGRYVLQPSSGVSCWTLESTQNLERNCLFDPLKLTVPTLSTMIRHKCLVIVSILFVIPTCHWDWPIVMISGSNQHLQQQLEYTPHIFYRIIYKGQ